MRNNVPMTLEQLKKELVNTNSCAGGYIVSFNSFIRIYEFVHRVVIRNPKDVTIVLIDMEAEGGAETEALFDKGGGYLEDAFRQVLRREDVAARCSKSQYVIMLINSDENQAKYVADRIIAACKKKDNAARVSFSYQMYSLDVRQEVDDELGAEYGQRFRDKCCIYNNQWISYCLENHHIDVETYEEKGKTLINRMCLHCGYKWTVQHEDNEDEIRTVWSEGRWWNQPLE